MIRNPEFLEIKGDGELFCNSFSLRIKFELFLINQERVIYCYLIEKSKKSLLSYWEYEFSIEGKTLDNRFFKATKLLITRVQDNYIELISNASIIIGEFFEIFADKIEYPIPNLYDINTSCSFNGFDIEIRYDKNNINKSISKYWQIPQTSSIIILKKENGLIEEYTKIINYLLRLLSLSTGRYLSFGIQHFYREQKWHTIIQDCKCSYRFIDGIIPNNWTDNFLNSGLPKIMCWEDEEFKDFKTIIEYLTSSNFGFLDDRLLMIIQSWEILANGWGNKNFKIPMELNNLKKKMRPILKEWHIEFPLFDKEKFWDGRLLKSLEWDRPIKTFEMILSENNIDNDKLKIDFRKLVKLRHKVAHRGRFGKEDAFDDIIKAQFTIRLVFLKLLNYRGEIINYLNDRIIKISEYER